MASALCTALVLPSSRLPWGATLSSLLRPVAAEASSGRSPRGPLSRQRSVSVRAVEGEKAPSHLNASESNVTEDVSASASASGNRIPENGASVGPGRPGSDVKGPHAPVAEEAGHPDLPSGAISILASLGALETLYLTYEKLYGGPLVCPFGGSCNDVLNSSYATLLGLPLSLYGFLAYSSVALLAQISRANARRGMLKDDVRWLVLALTSAMAGVSVFLLYLIKFELDSAFCAYCIASATLSGVLLLLTFQGFSGTEVRKALLPQTGLVAAAIVGMSVAFGDPRSALAGVQEIDLPPIEPEVTTASTPLEVRLAKHLSAVGAKMYGAFWCSHCYEQKQAFGQEAAKLLPYVECYPEGYRKGVKLAKACEEANLEGFPTWIINGELRPGEQELSVLARLTGFDSSK